MGAPSKAGGFFYMFYIMFFWLEPKEPKLPPFLIVKFKGVGESTDFKASESSAKMFARKPKTSEIGLRRTTSLGFAYRLRQQKFLRLPRSIFTPLFPEAISPSPPKGEDIQKYSLLISTVNRHKAGSA